MIRILTIFASLLLAVPALGDSWDALDEVNHARAARGLPPFQYDRNLAIAAGACAEHRAARRLAGHSSNDFAFVPAGTKCDATGCAAWPQGMGWGSCCSYEHYERAGAAYVIGPDGLRYMSLFVSGGSGSQMRTMRTRRR